jgi:hypothetical protein
LVVPRKGEPYRCTAIGIIFCGKMPGVSPDDGLADGEPDPHAILFRREERLAQFRQLLLGKAGAIVSR